MAGSYTPTRRSAGFPDRIVLVCLGCPPVGLLAQIWNRNLPILRSLVRNILIDPSLADDVLQDAFTLVISKRQESDFKDEHHAYSYMRRAVVNTAINYYRRRRREIVDLKEREAKSRRIQSENWTPLSLLIREEQENLQANLMRQVQTTVEELSPEQKEAITLVFTRNQKLKQVCKERGIPYTTLRSRAFAAVDEIRKRLQIKGVLPATRSGSYELRRSAID